MADLGEALRDRVQHILCAEQRDVLEPRLDDQLEVVVAAPETRDGLSGAQSRGEQPGRRERQLREGRRQWCRLDAGGEGL